MSQTEGKYFEVNSKSSAALSGRGSGYQVPRTASLLGANFSTMSQADKTALLREILENKIHGISYSPYLDGQEPGMDISAEQIRARMEIIQPYTRWIRSFSCIEGNQETPRIAQEMGLKTMVGIGLGHDKEKNEIELANGIEIGRAGHADILAVGNEIMLRGDMSEDDLINYINRVREAVPGVPVSYVDAYFLFENYPRLADACDVLLVNCYPFWESCAADYSLLYMQEMYRRACIAAKGKKVIISETGWPSIGSPFGAAMPSYDNALEYFIRTYQWAEQDDIEIFYFSSFDESWKTGDEGDVGAYWGLWDKDGNLKYA